MLLSLVAVIYSSYYYIKVSILTLQGDTARYTGSFFHVVICRTIHELLGSLYFDNNPYTQISLTGFYFTKANHLKQIQYLIGYIFPVWEYRLCRY